MVVTRLLIASDVRLYSEGLSTRLASAPGVRISAVVADAPALIAARELADTDVVLIDISMADSLEAVRVLRTRCPAIRVIGLCVPEVEDVVIPCIMAGLAGYLPRHGSIEQLISLIGTVARGETFASPHIIASIFRRLSAADHEHTAEHDIGLSVRELEIVRLLEAGCSNKQIAKELHIRLPTVKKHVHAIFGKLHIERRGQVAEAVRNRRRRHWQMIQPEPRAHDANMPPRANDAARALR